MHSRSLAARVDAAMCRFIVAGVLSIFVVVFGTEARGQAQGFSRAELAALPTWCHSTLTFTTSVGQGSHFHNYVIRYGKGWNHVHHYCWALIAMMRYDRPGNSSVERQGFAHSALTDMQYVLRNVGPDFVLWPDIVARKTRLLVRERRLNEAMESANEMLSAYPTRADSHGLVAEVLYEAGRRSQARQVLDKAESAVEDPDRLERIRTVLGL